MQRFNEILSVIEAGRSLGCRALENGTQLIGHVPHVAPEAWLHLVFAPLTDTEIRELEEKILKRAIPAVYKEFLTLSNGLSLFSGSLSLDGFRKNYIRTGDAVWQPFALETPNIYERPRDARDSCFFIGGYKRDGSMLFLENERAFRCARNSVTPLNEWKDFWEMLVSETARLCTLFDDRGRKIDPKGSTTPPSPGLVGK